MKLLFLIGQCVRLVGSDTWQDPTMEIIQMGKYSYEIRVVAESLRGYGNQIGTLDWITYRDQKEYEVVSCPKLEKESK